jgi:hypothetical protein
MLLLLPPTTGDPSFPGSAECSFNLTVVPNPALPAPDRDPDGLLDVWETDGIDADVNAPRC